MKRHVAVIMLFAAAYLHAELPPEMQGAEAVRLNLLLRHPPPEFPYEVRRTLKTYSGVFLLRFDYESGQPRQIHIAKSSGNETFDASVVAALKQWQAKPRSLKVIRVPITFTHSAPR